MPVPKRIRWLAAALAVLLGAACAQPLVVTDITSSENQIKFAWTEGGSGGRQGIVQCTVDEEGNLSACRHIKLEFRE